MTPSRLPARRPSAILAALALLSACGGGDGGGSIGGGTVTPGPTPTPTSTPAAGTCSLAARKDWVRAQMNEWYLFPDTLPASIDPAAYGDVQSFIDALTATARSQRKDRYFTYITSIAEENAYYSSGSSAGFGVRFSLDTAARRLFVSESFEGAPALAAGIDRGAEILAIGTSAATLRNVGDILASEGSAGIANALGANTVGLSRALRVADAAGTRNVTLAKADYALAPVSSRYGAKVIDDGGRKVGYVNLRTFITTAEAPLRAAFADFRAQGITEVIVDLRYNGGGLISIADLVNNLMARDRTTSTVANYVTFRPSKASENETVYFTPQSQSIAPTRVAFIGTSGTASASELVMNSFIPYLGNRAALIGTNTYGKPVGQIAIDRSACDDRLRVIAFALENASHQGAYYDGIAPFMGATCQAADNVTRQLGDPAEGSTRAALDFLAGRSCGAVIAEGGAGPAARSSALRPRAEMALLSAERPSAAQREVPGLF